MLGRLLEERRWHSGRPDAAYHSDDRQSFADSGGHDCRLYARHGYRFRTGRQGRPEGYDDRRRQGLRVEQADDFRRHRFQSRGVPLVRGRQCDLDALRLLSLAGGRGYSRGILGQGRSERRQLHGFGPDRGREGGRQADAVVHADDLQAQDVAHRYRRDERIGFRYYEYRHQGRRGDGRTRSHDGQLYGQSGRGGFRPDRQYGDCEQSLLCASGAAERCQTDGYRHHGRRQETYADARYGRLQVG